MSNEACARVKIDALLAAQGWDLLDTTAVRFEVQLPDGTRADYVLCDRHGRSLAVIDACGHQNHVFKVRSDQACLSPAYLRALAGSAYSKAYFLSVAKKTTGIASINKTQLSAFSAPLPPLPLQQAFERRVQTAELILNQQAEALKKATAAFDAILSQSIW